MSHRAISDLFVETASESADYNAYIEETGMAYIEPESTVVNYNDTADAMVAFGLRDEEEGRVLAIEIEINLQEDSSHAIVGSQAVLEEETEGRRIRTNYEYDVFDEQVSEV